MNSQITILNILLLTSTPVFSWSDKGHITMGQMAYELLSPNTKEALNTIFHYTFRSNLIFDLQQEYLIYGNFSPFALITTLPDKFKEQNIEQFYRTLNSTIPDEISEFNTIQIKHYHRKNKCYPDKNCIIFHPLGENIFLENLIDSIKKSDVSEKQAASITLMLHIAMDYHQPLHTFGLVDSECKYDKGGNKFCLSPLKDRKCPETDKLHYIFDTICFDNITETAKRIDANYHLQALPKEEKYYDLSYKKWWAENYEYAEYVYSIKQYQGLPVEYEKTIKEILDQRIALATFRLWLRLEDIFKDTLSTYENNTCDYTDKAIEFYNSTCALDDEAFG